MKTFKHSCSALPGFIDFRNLIYKASCIFLPGLIVVSILTSCSFKTAYDTPKVTASKRRNVAAPPGMVYVPAGSINYKSSGDDEAAIKKVGLSPFFIDATEVTNKQFKAFVNWVADSIAVTDYLKDDSYFLSPKKNKNSSLQRRINWNKVRSKSPLWQSSDPTIQGKLSGLVKLEGGRRVLSKEVLNYRFSYFSTRRDSVGKLTTESVSVLPDHSVWASDFPNSQMNFMVSNYFNHRVYDNHPVVGVTWKQARAYTYWRSSVESAMFDGHKALRSYRLAFSLPTEAQWQYAAAGLTNSGAQTAPALMTFKDRREKTDQLSVNFKQGEGDYVKDGSIFTLPVKSYMANEFGLFNMSGNVSEWTLDAFSVSASELIHDLNPVLLYDANDQDPAPMKRKVVRGGSWKDNAELLSLETRGYELQDVAHSYIGFRCVLPAPEPLTDQVKTRKKVQDKTANPSPKKKGSKAEEKLSAN